MDDTERQQLADRLSGLSFQAAKHREMRKIDRDAVLIFPQFLLG